MNYLLYLIDWGGSGIDASIPGATATKVNLASFTDSADDAGVLVDRISMVALGRLLPSTPRASVVKAVERWTQATDGNNWKTSRVKRAAYLVYASPDYQIQR
jgi:hypothetical protein